MGVTGRPKRSGIEHDSESAGKPRRGRVVMGIKGPRGVALSRILRAQEILEGDGWSLELTAQEEVPMWWRQRPKRGCPELGSRGAPVGGLRDQEG